MAEKLGSTAEITFRSEDERDGEFDAYCVEALAPAGHGPAKTAGRHPAITAKDGRHRSRGQAEAGSVCPRVRPIAPDLPSPAEHAEIFHRIIEHASVGVLILARNRILYANPEAARIFGFRSGDDLVALGDVSLLLAEGERPGLNRIIAGMLAGRRALPVYDAIGVRADGSKIQLEARPTLIEQKNVRAVCAIVSDVTSRRKTEAMALSQIAELAHLDRICTLGQMSATIMHEIAQPLTALSLSGGTLRRLLAQSPPGIEMALRTAHAIEAEATRMRETVYRIKQFASGNIRRPDNWEPVDILAAVEQAFMLTAPAFNGSEVARGITCEADAPARAVRADQVQLVQIVVNLMTNALDSLVESGATDGKVAVRVRRVGGDVVVDVIDNGPGVPPELAERIFEPFFSTKQKGVGIGLAVCRSIVESFDGSLRQLPAAGGGGAVFRMRLPAMGGG